MCFGPQKNLISIIVASFFLQLIELIIPSSWLLSIIFYKTNDFSITRYNLQNMYSYRLTSAPFSLEMIDFPVSNSRHFDIRLWRRLHQPRFFNSEATTGNFLRLQLQLPHSASKSTTNLSKLIYSTSRSFRRQIQRPPVSAHFQACSAKHPIPPIPSPPELRLPARK